MSFMHDFPGGFVVKNWAVIAGDSLPIQGLVLASGRSSGEGNGNLRQSCHIERSLVGYSPWGCRVRQALAIKQQHPCLPAFI